MNVLDKKYTSYYLQWLQLKLQMGDVEKILALHLLEHKNKIITITVTVTVHSSQSQFTVTVTVTVFWSQQPELSSPVDYI